MVWSATDYFKEKGLLLVHATDYKEKGLLLVWGATVYYNKKGLLLVWCATVYFKSNEKSISAHFCMQCPRAFIGLTILTIPWGRSHSTQLAMFSKFRLNQTKVLKYHPEFDITLLAWGWGGLRVM